MIDAAEPTPYPEIPATNHDDDNDDDENDNDDVDAVIDRPMCESTPITGTDITTDSAATATTNTAAKEGDTRSWYRRFCRTMERMMAESRMTRDRDGNHDHDHRTAYTYTYTASAAAAATILMIGYEIMLQRRLTAPPIVYGQITPDPDNNRSNRNRSNRNRSNRTKKNDITHHQFHPFSLITIADVYQHMIQIPSTHNNRNIIQRAIQPSLFVGTRAHVSSTMAYLIQHYHISESLRRVLRVPNFTPTDYQRRHYHYDRNNKTVQFREVMNMPSDGATIAIDWKFPYDTDNNDNGSNNNDHMSIEEWMEQIVHGPISRPVVLILHGINNHTQFGYMQSMMNTCCTKGRCIAAGMNFRGCAIPTTTATTAEPPLFDATTPRTYNGAYTGDLRTVVQKLSVRLRIPPPAPSPIDTQPEHAPQQSLYQPLFLVGNSLGANLLTKYLGEEGRCSTLHPCIAGGVTMGNPLHMDSRNASPIISPLIALGAKRGLYNIYPTMKGMVRSSSYFRQCISNGWKAVTLADFDNAMAPIFCRNEPSYPFQYQIGYHNNNGKDAAEEYWIDMSSYRQVPHITVPFLQLIARDDFLTYRSFRDRMHYNIVNPYVMVMETTCGGHLGWHEAIVQDDTDPENRTKSWTQSLLGTSWADVAMIDFIQAILEVHQERQLACRVNGNIGNQTNENHNINHTTSQTGKASSGTGNDIPLRSRL